MDEQRFIHYSRIAEAIKYIQKNSKEQLTVEEVAKKVNLSSSHFQKLFIDWAGISPEKFMQYISVPYAKRILDNSRSALFEAINKTTPADTARLHHLFVETEGMSSEEDKNKGEGLTINYSFAENLFGEILIASTHKGICYMGFSDDKQMAFSKLGRRFP